MDKISQIQSQHDLETVFSKYQLNDVLEAEYAEVTDQHPVEEERKFINAVLCAMFKQRQADPCTLVGMLSPKFGDPQMVADGLLALAELDYLDYDGNREIFSILIDLTDDVKEALDLYQYPLPMIVPPVKVQTNEETGYLTIDGSLILNGDYLYGKKTDICLDHINRMNSIPLIFDMDTIDSSIGEFDSPERKPEEDFNDFQKRVKQARVFFEDSVGIIKGLSNLADQVYITYKYDRRGRTYSSGYHVNPQGTDYAKAAIQLGNKELVK